MQTIYISRANAIQPWRWSILVRVALPHLCLLYCTGRRRRLFRIDPKVCQHGVLLKPPGKLSGVPVVYINLDIALSFVLLARQPATLKPPPTLPSRHPRHQS